MCRIPKVLIVAPADRQTELRKKLSSLEYDVAAAVDSADAASAITADVAVAWEPDEEEILRLRELGMKVVAIGGAVQSADMELDPGQVEGFRSRIWELFRPA